MQADSSDSGDDIDDASLSADHKSAWRPEDCKPASPTTAMPPLATGKPFPTGPARARKSSDVLSDTLKSKKIAASSFVTNVEKAARNRINALLTLGRQKPHSDTDPVRNTNPTM